MGERLSCVIIDRLPFPSPGDPLVQARIEALEARGLSGFDNYMIPSAIVRLKQGFGRLVRSKTDRGMVALLDGRAKLITLRRAHLAGAATPLPHYSPRRIWAAFSPNALMSWGGIVRAWIRIIRIGHCDNSDLCFTPGEGRRAPSATDERSGSTICGRSTRAPKGRQESSTRWTSGSFARPFVLWCTTWRAHVQDPAFRHARRLSEAAPGFCSQRERRQCAFSSAWGPT